MALTMKPANKSATIDIVKDTNAPTVSKSMTKITNGEFEPLHKSVAMQNMFYVSDTLQFVGIESVQEKLFNALQTLRKTLTAGGSNAAPGSLTGGSAIQKESHLKKLVKVIGNKRITRDEIKKTCPSLSDEDADKVAMALKLIKHREQNNSMNELYVKMKKSVPD
jgi:hypothetical protein